ncbi:MAG: hypothetical protein IKU54_03425 [Oscillospiraceae bacterium]|nr:hypothetical protein [Oscillospiraceae bacterium]
MNSKKFIAITFAFTILLLSMVAIPIIKIDPFFHYHKPVEGLEYYINFDSQRYVNDGIIRNFDYDAMIIGTSMTENFCSTDVDGLFNVNSIKVPYSGASFCEIGQKVELAAEKNENLKLVVRGLDFVGVNEEKDYMAYDESSYPTYLYNDNIFDDVKYVLDKEVLFSTILYQVIEFTEDGGKTPSFDDYCSWYNRVTFSKEATLKSYTRPEISDEIKVFDEEYKQQVYENVMQNLVNVAKNNPDIEFYYYYTPYSIIYFDREMRNGHFLQGIAAAEYATELMLECPNIKLFSFFDNYELICNLDFYKDIIHHSEAINIRILKWMRNDTGLLTKDNYKQHFEDMRQFYMSYDYENIFIEDISADEITA